MLSNNFQLAGRLFAFAVIAATASLWSTVSASPLCPPAVCMMKTCPPPYTPVGTQTSLSPEQETLMHYLKLGLGVFEGYLSVRTLIHLHFDLLMSI